MKAGQFHKCNAYVTWLDNQKWRLTSYWSTVCDVDLIAKKIVLYPRYKFSTTTTQHLVKFLRETVGFHMYSDDIKRNTKDGKHTFKYNGYTVVMSTLYKDGVNIQ